MRELIRIAKLSIPFIFILCLLFSPVSTALASAPYEGYNYSSWGETTPSPIAYRPDRVVDGYSLGIDSFNQPRDIYISADRHIYVADTGNNRIVVLNDRYEFVRAITEFRNGTETDSFRSPYGVFVTEDNDKYIADMDNARIVQLDADDRLVKIIDSPQSEILVASFVFRPTKVIVDKAERVYAVSQGTFDGIIEFDADGHFSGFVGANRVQFNPVDYFWKMVATQEQRNRMLLFVPTEYTNADIDERGFIYTTNSDANTSRPIRRLNPTGIDVLRSQGYWPPVGDLNFTNTGDAKGPSLFSDITVTDSGIYSALDGKRGKIFTYDWDGNLLYVFGKMGDQVGTFSMPAAIDYLGDDIVVLDRATNRLTVFGVTPIGAWINEAVRLHFQGEDAQSAELWRKVIEYDANYGIAYIGISKALLRQGLNEEAAHYAELGKDRNYYSKGFQRHRKDVLRDQLGNVFTIGIAAMLGVIVIRAIRKRRGKAQHV
ncbi:NHL repeat-containing protein [Paenibacillus sp. PAMC21692]|uniref:NHL repeat-containing protein n=1 Tax=Paenibacillus sp. PAMC21692 TaxID=2762320 RepID=UPI00164D341B|nr:NHL repeat-containing protein [Paenibacillus sp. PAMC21692]QNK57035.1 NHL repeat-containing protein [Paenibacillus sp. PAMC21692]